MLRVGFRCLRANGKNIKGISRTYSNQAGNGQQQPFSRLSGAIAVGAIAGLSLGKLIHNNYTDNSVPTLMPIAKCFWGGGNSLESHQPSVVSGTKQHALYLTIHLSNGSDAKHCARLLQQRLQRAVDEIAPADMRDEEDEILAGIGFSQSCLNRIGLKAPESYEHRERHGDLGSMPSTGGDVFIHAKCNSYGSLFELGQKLLKVLPKGSIAKAEDIYGFVYRNGRDLSGFIDGTENPADEDSRKEVALNKKSGGSFVITQRWVHKHNVIDNNSDEKMSEWIGRKREDSSELQNKSITAHVARMTGGTKFENPKKFEIVRQSQPYGDIKGENGLFFIAYTATPRALDYMLDRMTGKDADGKCDDVMQLTSCVASNYFYFPSNDELNKL